MSILAKVNHRLESRMREIRLSGSEGGGAESNRPSLPLLAYIVEAPPAGTPCSAKTVGAPLAGAHFYRTGVSEIP